MSDKKMRKPLQIKAIEVPITDVWRLYPHWTEAGSIAAAVAALREQYPTATIRFVCEDGSVYAGNVAEVTG